MSYSPDDKIRVSTSLALQVIAWIVGLMTVYGAVNARVAVLENDQRANDKRLERIEMKLDALVARP